MRITVNWLQSFSNLPEWQLRLPCEIHPEYKYKWFPDQMYYYGENDNFVDFYYYSGPGRGYGGIEIPIALLDGTSKVLKGPFSGNVAQVNGFRFWDQYPGAKQPAVAVACHESRYRCIGRYCTLQLIQQYCPPDIHIVCVANNRVIPDWKTLDLEIPFQFIPSISPTEIKKP